MKSVGSTFWPGLRAMTALYEAAVLVVWFHMLLGIIDSHNSGVPLVLCIWTIFALLPAIGVAVLAFKREAVSVLDMRRLLAVLVLVALLVLGVLLLPPVANNLRYALPYASLPTNASIGGRDYVRSRLCISPVTAAVEKGGGYARVGSIWTFLGASHPVMALRPAAESTDSPTVLFVPQSSCFQLYELQGGP